MERSRECFLRHADSGNFTEALSPEPHFPAPFFSQILPAWIELLNKRNLLFPPPAFHLFFTRNGHLHILVALVVNQTMALILPGETFNGLVLVLVNAAWTLLLRILQEKGKRDNRGTTEANQKPHKYPKATAE